jgi:hypothetical protein
MEERVTFPSINSIKKPKLKPTYEKPFTQIELVFAMLQGFNLGFSLF